MSPLQRYQQDLLRPDFQFDPAQKQAIEKLQNLFEQLAVAEKISGSGGFFKRLKQTFIAEEAQSIPVMGLYFWGGVGRGKTYLMDIFFESLPFDQKLRVHFHRFMQMVHEELKALPGVKNPLDVIAKKIALNAKVICFDEFFVSDITDAMILGGLFEKLFDLGVTLVATSNIIPDELYKNGLQRQRFLPAIAQIKRHCEVVNVDGGIDYRLRALEQAELYYYPLSDDVDVSLMQAFKTLASVNIKVDVPIAINRRFLQARYEADDIVWFDFVQLCDGPRSQNDYIELAKLYHAVILSQVPVIDANKEDQARRFINLVDEFYDRNVKLIISAEVSIKDLYQGSRLVFEFERTQSRLLEMQSHDYLAAEHKP